MSLSLKSGDGAARIHGLRPEMILGVLIAEGVFRDNGHDLCITAGIDGKHMDGSLHYAGCAVDLRTRDIPGVEVEIIRKMMQDRLGVDFDVVIEGDHLHFEFQPKKTYTG